MDQVSDKPLVLVVDDDDEFREEIIPEALGRLNARIRKAKNVVEACELVAEPKHDAHGEDPLRLIVLDMHMPVDEKSTKPARAGGIQVLGSWEILAAFAPVVVFTAYASFRNCVRSVRAGAAAYLPKDVVQDAHGESEGGIDDLVETCRRLLTKPEPEEERLPPDADWFDQNSDWLRQEFGDRWVAFVAASEEAWREAESAGIAGTERAGVFVVGRESKKELARILPRLGENPLIAFVPRTEEELDEASQEI